MTKDEKIAIGVIAASAVGILLIKLFGKEHYNYDVNGDGVVDDADLQCVADHMGETGPPGWIPEDVNKDGVVNVLDLILVGQHHI